MTELTVKDVREWLAALPEEFQTAPFYGAIGSTPFAIKRIIAYRESDGKLGVVTNTMGSHSDMDHEWTWVSTLKHP